MKSLCDSRDKDCGASRCVNLSKRDYAALHIGNSKVKFKLVLDTGAHPGVHLSTACGSGAPTSPNYILVRAAASSVGRHEWEQADSSPGLTDRPRF